MPQAPLIVVFKAALLTPQLIFWAQRLFTFLVYSAVQLLTSSLPYNEATQDMVMWFLL